MTDVNIYDSFFESNLNYISEEQEDVDKSIKGNPISDEIKENSKHKGVIGKIGGIGADSNEPTRNGRRYPLQLWQNVEKSEYFIEGMKNRTLIGEADHPTERLDYSVTEGAVVLTKYEIQNNGQVYTEFDILDTIPGRTVKTYFDAGCKLGVSSRGLGEEVMLNGEKIIDPETYQFYCFDVVAFPAVKSARMDLIESTSPKKQVLINSINGEIKKCKSIDEVLFIESMSKGVNLYLDEIRESIEIKKKELSENNEDDNVKTLATSIVDKIKNRENKTAQDIQLCDFLSAWLDKKNENIANLFNKLKEENDKLDKNNKIKISGPNDNSDEDTPEVVDRQPDNNLEILAELQESDKINVSKINKLKTQLEQKNAIIRNLLAKYHVKTETLHSIKESHEWLKNEKDKDDKINSENESLKEQLSQVTSKYEKLQEVNKNFLSMFEELNSNTLSIKQENDSLKKRVNTLKRNNIAITENYKSLVNENKQLKENIKTYKDANNQVKVLNENVIQLKQQNENLKSDNEKRVIAQEKLISQLNNKNKNLNKKYIESLDKYISSVCMKYNLNRSTLIRLLGESYTTDDIDKIAKELVENNSKINSLPFSHLTPNRQIVNENIALTNNSNNNISSELETFNMLLTHKN